ncbi:hypothetical protein AB0L06_34515 [Spirillospora sp. NPDC052269]
MLMTGVASLSMGFVLGWIVASPRRLDAHFCGDPAHGHEVHGHDARCIEGHGPDACRTVRPAAADPDAVDAVDAASAMDAGDVARRTARTRIRERVAALLHLTSRA